MPNLFKRVLSAIFLIPLVLFVIAKGGVPFFICCLILYFVAVYEWASMTIKADKRFLWWFGGILYLTPAFITLVLLERYRNNDGADLPWVLLMVLFIAWASDIFAYIFGKTIGGPKIAPKISPNKTWAGFFGALIGTGLLFLAFYFSSERVATIWHWLLPLFLFLSVISAVGDFFESWVKRKFNIKDSGNLIPGHGGLLDRIDGLILMLNFIGWGTIIIYVSEIGFNV